MQKTLIDILSIKNNKQELSNIKAHLLQLLNTRRGSLTHLPDYGLPDLQEMYQSLPYSIHKFCETIKKTIAKYEKRLGDINIRHEPEKNGGSVLFVEITGHLYNGNILKYGSHFLSEGTVILQQCPSINGGFRETPKTAVYGWALQ